MSNDFACSLDGPLQSNTKGREVLDHDRLIELEYVLAVHSMCKAGMEKMRRPTQCPATGCNTALLLCIYGSFCNTPPESTTHRWYPARPGMQEHNLR